ncbi:MAG: NADH-quinone oxidoreductase subunit J [Actinobacteria bacterium]|nr:NADH-quinone oxidoreductase subunit J [Actinomycetota bacterium]NIS34550.1 NADH-quinone oxidoreductase subunit J [Actinomycetota bacterium]NIT97571.1 NADH-quinone oxidoreductase subunit J [Actinomycetota bacterium]NIU21229.1 NADH-quinone oxidoreductase subunit J [Actinomycetota bacterium]NIU69314.1 NADH-quinone oxidoreductase subunit J [Actinomycetota bacterium]
MTEVVVFLVAAALMVGGGLGVVLSRNPVHSALFLIQTLFGVAVLFVLQEAHFLAAVQVIVYAGAIVVLFLFVIMLLGVDKAEDLSVDPVAGQRQVGVILGAAVTALGLVVVLVATDGLTGRVATARDRVLENSEFTDIERIGRVLFSEYALAFEITAALLTIAVIGAVVLTRSVAADEVLDDLERDDLSLPAAAPFGANDSDLLDSGSDGSGPEVPDESGAG